MDIVGHLQEGMRRFSAQASRVATFILQYLSFTASASIDELAVNLRFCRIKVATRDSWVIFQLSTVSLYSTHAAYFLWLEQ